MEQADFINVVEVFNDNALLYIGLMPNIDEAKFGYSYTNKNFTLYCQATDRSIKELKKKCLNNKSIHFIKWANDGNIIQGDGIVIILETIEERVNGINYILKHYKENNELNLDKIDNLFLFKIEVNNACRYKQ